MQICQLSLLTEISLKDYHAGGGGVRGLLQLEKIIFKFTQLSITTNRPWTLTPLSIGPPPFGKKTLESMLKNDYDYRRKTACLPITNFNLL